MNINLNGKKGSIDDKIYWYFGFLLLVITVIVSRLLWGNIYEFAMSLDSNAVNTLLAGLSPDTVTSWLDWVAAGMYFTMNIFVCVLLPMRVRYNPIYYVLVFLFLFLFVIVVAINSNVIVEFASDMDFTLTMTMWIIRNNVLLEVVFVLIMAVIMFSKWKEDSEGVYYGG